VLCRDLLLLLLLLIINTININLLIAAGARGEDTGTLACQQLGNDDIIAYVDVTVYGKILQSLAGFYSLF